VVHVDIIQAIFPCLLHVDVIDSSPGQELLIACGIWMRFSLSFIFNFTAHGRTKCEFSEVDVNYILGLPNTWIDRRFDYQNHI